MTATFDVPLRQRQLFVDDRDLVGAENVRRTLHQPDKKGAVIRPNWTIGISTVQTRSAPAWDPVDRLYKLWFFGSCPPDLPPGRGWTGLYAESADGLHWSSPPLNQVAHRGSAENNFVALSVGDRRETHEAVVFDPTETDPTRRFKGWTWLRGDDRNYVVQPIASDGATWRSFDVPAIPSQDEFNLSYDAQDDRFIGTVKHGGKWGRSVFLTTSDDFLTWTAPELIFEADDEDQARARLAIEARRSDPTLYQPRYDPAEYGADVYNMGTFRYESVYLGLPAFFHHAARDHSGRNHDGFHLVQLVVSRDLRRWERVADRATFIGPSPLGAGAYDTTQILPPSAPGPEGPPRHDELWFYYTGIRYRDPGEDADRDQGAICLATLRRDGFVSLDAGANGGIVRTRPFAAAGDRLFVNVAAPRGELRVRALDPTGATLGVSEPLTGDRPGAEVRWSGASQLSLRGRTLSLEFALRDGSLYSYWIDD